MSARRLRGIAFTLLLLWLSASLFVAPKLALQVPENPVTVTPAERGLDYDDVVIDSDGLALPGWWIAPEQPKAILVWAHGGGSNRHSTFFDSLGFYGALVERNIAVLTFDQRNHGNAPRDTGHFTLGQTESRDVQAALSWVSAHNPQQLPVVLMGVSMGGASSIYAVSAGARVDGLILADAVLDPMDVLIHGGWIAYGVPPALFLPMGWGAVLFEGINSGADAPAAKLAQLDTETLFLQSPDDPITRAIHARAVAAENPAITLMEAPAVPAGHACINFKGRWGSHASAFLCHPEWTMLAIDAYLARILPTS